jgi:uncharacterized protein
VLSKGFTTSLSEAAEIGDLERIRAILADGVDPNEFGPEEWTHLIHAAYTDQLEAAVLLLDAGADMYKRDAANDSPFKMACRQGSIGVFRNLIDRGYEFDAERDDAVEIMTSARHIEILRFLLDHGINVDTADDGGRTALLSAALALDFDTVEELIRQGADVNHRDADGESILMWVADEDGRAEMLRLLIADGAEVNALNVAAEPIAMTDALSWTMLHGDVDMIRVLLDNGADIHQTDALSRATYNRHVKAIRLLLEYGADPNLPDCYRKSAVDTARTYRTPEVLDLLLQASERAEG